MPDKIRKGVMNDWSKLVGDYIIEHPEIKKVIYNAGLSKGESNPGNISIAVACMMYAISQKGKTFEDLPRTSLNEKKMFIEDFMEFLKENPIRGNQPSYKKRNSLRRMGRIFKEGMDAVCTLEMEYPEADVLMDEKKRTSFITDTYEGLAMQIGYFSKLHIERITELEDITIDERESFYSGAEGLENFNKMRDQARLLHSMRLIMFDTFRSPDNKVFSEAMDQYAKKSFPKAPDDGDLYDALNDTYFLKQHAEKLSLTTGYIRSNADKGVKSTDEFIKAAEQATENKMKITAEADEEAQKQWKDHGPAQMKRNKQFKLEEEVRNTLRNAEKEGGFEFAYQVYCYEKRADSAPLEESSTINSQMREFLSGLFEDPKRAAAYYQGLVERKVQLMASAASDSKNIKQWIVDGTHGMNEYTMFSDNAEITGAIADVMAKTKNADDIALYDRLINSIPEKFRTLNEEVITQKYLSTNAELKAGYDYFKAIDPDKIAEKYGVGESNGSATISDETIELHRKAREKKKYEEERAKAYGEEKDRYKNVFDKVAAVNSADRNGIFDENLPMNKDDQAMKVISEGKMYSASTESLEENEKVFDSIFGEVMKDPEFSLDNFEVGNSGVKDSAITGVQNEQNKIQSENHKNMKYNIGGGKLKAKTVLFNDKPGFERRVELLTKTMVLQYMRMPESGLRYQQVMKNGDNLVIDITNPPLPERVVKQTEQIRKAHEDEFRSAMEHLQKSDKLDFYRPKLCKKDAGFNIAKMEIDDVRMAATAFDKVFEPLMDNQEKAGYKIPEDLVIDVQVMEYGSAAVRERSLGSYISKMVRESGNLMPYETVCKAFVIQAMINGEPAIKFRPRFLDPAKKGGIAISGDENTVNITKAVVMPGFEVAAQKFEEERKLEEEKKRQAEKAKAEELKKFTEEQQKREAIKDAEYKKRSDKEREEYLKEKAQKEREAVKLNNEKRQKFLEDVENDLNAIRQDLSNYLKPKIEKDLGPRELTGERTKLPSYTDRFKVSDFIEGFDQKEVKDQLAEMLKNAGFPEPASEECLQKTLITYLMGVKAGEIDELLKNQGDAANIQGMDIADKILALSPENKKALGEKFKTDISAHPTAGLLAGSPEKTQENLAWYGAMFHKALKNIKDLKGEGAKYPTADELDNLENIKKIKLTKFGFAADMAEFYDTHMSGLNDFDNSVTADNPYGISKGSAFVNGMGDPDKPDPTGNAQLGAYRWDKNTVKCLLAVGSVFKVAETHDPNNKNENRIKAYRIMGIREAATSMGDAPLSFGNTKEDWNRGIEYGSLSTGPIEDEAMEALCEVSDEDMKKGLENGEAFDPDKPSGAALDKARDALVGNQNYYFYLEQEKPVRQALHEAFDTDHPELYELDYNAPDMVGMPLNINALTPEQLAASEKTFDRMFTSLRIVEDTFLSEMRAFSASHEYDDITAKFLIDGVPVMKYVLEKAPLPKNLNPAQTKEEWYKRHQMGKALVLKELADPNGKLTYRPGLMNPNDMSYTSNLPMDVRKPDPNAAQKRNERKEYYKAHPEEVKAYADVAAEKQNEPKVENKVENKAVNNATNNAENKAENKPAKKVKGPAELYTEAIERFNTKRWSVFEQESALHVKVNNAAKAMFDLRKREKDRFVTGLERQETDERRMQYSVDWMMTAQEMLDGAETYISEKNPFTFAGADRYGGAKDLRNIARKEIEICKEHINEKQTDGFSLNKVREQIADKKMKAAERQLKGELVEDYIWAEERNVDYERLNSGEKNERAFAKSLLVDSIAAYTVHEHLAKGQEADFYSVRKTLRKDKALSNALDRYLSSGNLDKDTVRADLSNNLKGLATKLTGVNALSHVRNLQTRLQQQQNIQPQGQVPGI